MPVDDSLITRDQVFEFIVRYKQEHDGLSPSLAEIASECQLSPSTVKYHLLVLERDRRIRVIGRRSIEIPGGAWKGPDKPTRVRKRS
jgi:hypothetical protein